MKKCIILDNYFLAKKLSKSHKLIFINYDDLLEINNNPMQVIRIMENQIENISKQKYNIIINMPLTTEELKIITNCLVTKGYKYLPMYQPIKDKVIKDFLYEDSFIKLEHSAMAIIFYNDEIVVTYEKIYTDIAISLPKGHINKNEKIIDAAIREAYEEAGIELTYSDLYYEEAPYATYYITPNDTEIVKIIYPIVFKINEKRPLSINESRIKKVVYMKKDEFIKLCSYHNIKQLISNIKL